jgi:glycosyltransferase involved in cell wall biosynthesis
MDKAYFAGIKSQVTRLGLQNRITFYGSHPNATDIMPALDIVVLATKMETFGLVLIEAMRSGVAVVGSNAGGVPEIIEDGVTGLLFEPGDAYDLAVQLRKYIADRNFRNRVAVAGKTRADQRFSLERHYGDLKRILNHLVGQHNPGNA